MILGEGQEGIVRRRGDLVEKCFRPGVLDDAKVAWLRQALRGTMPYIPEPTWTREGGTWSLRYPWFETSAVEQLGLAELREFLLFCLDKGIVCANVNRSNFRRRVGGGLTFVDVGAWIVPMNVDYFRDAAARGFVIAAHGWSDEELRRRSCELREPAALEQLDGFPDFYRALLTAHARKTWKTEALSTPALLAPADDVTLLVKACAMDAAAAHAQIRHIVGQLEMPRRFARRVLLIDPFEGPFLRAYADGDLRALLAVAEALKAEGVLDELWVAPTEGDAAACVNARWFDIAVGATHSARGVPVTPQVWAFDRIETRYVLQCDVDVLIGRRDLSHDYLSDMRRAARSGDVLGVAFNIPQPNGVDSRPYDAPAGAFVPEVRCGLLDLERVRACRPLPNGVENGRLTRSWYRALESHQQATGLRTLRGGDARTFYVHPQNSVKNDPAFTALARDLVAQGLVPDVQRGEWDLAGSTADWDHPSRSESIVFLIKGANVGLERAARCFSSLAAQGDQRFGIVIIDDASAGLFPWQLGSLLKPFAGRCTLVRRPAPAGRMPNFLLGISEVCTNPETLVVILDMDDALIGRHAVARIREEYERGCDVIHAEMFRPDKPTKLYHPDFAEPRKRWGGETWTHLRAFRKRLFDAVPVEHFQIDGRWIDQCTDYATMIPIVEQSRKPVFIPEYLYFHERSTPRTKELRVEKDAIIRRILAKPSLARGCATPP